MMRRLILAFFVLATLTSHVSVAFACEMMGNRPIAKQHCCCKKATAGIEHRTAMDDPHCCRTIVELSVGVSDQTEHLGAAIKMPTGDPHAALPMRLPTLLAAPLTAQSTSWVRDQRDDHAMAGAELYLRTQRLRL